LLELGGAYRAMASGILAEPHIIDRVTDASGEVLYEASRSAAKIGHRPGPDPGGACAAWSASRKAPPTPWTAATSRSR
jgi:membrane carboxypeptidase/penicillin-binding protein